MLQTPEELERIDRPVSTISPKVISLFRASSGYGVKPAGCLMGWQVCLKPLHSLFCTISFLADQVERSIYSPCSKQIYHSNRAELLQPQVPPLNLVARDINQFSPIVPSPDWYGRTLVKIERWFPSSKRCGKCGHIVEKRSLNIGEWDCPNCGAHHDRDINAPQNILAPGLAVKVCGTNVRPDRHKSYGSCDATNRSKKWFSESPWR